MSKSYLEYMSEVDAENAREYAEDKLLHNHKEEMQNFILAEVEREIKHNIAINWFDEEEIKQARSALAELTIFFKTGDTLNPEHLKNALKDDVENVDSSKYENLNCDHEKNFVFSHIILDLKYATREV